MALNTDYDIEKAFRAIEDELIASMIRNLDGHRAEAVSYTHLTLPTNSRG